VIEKYVGKAGLLILAGLLTLPIWVVLYKVTDLNAEGWYHLRQNLLGTYVRNTLWVTLGVAAVSGILGVASAWWVTTREFPFRKSLEWLLMLPLSIPTFISGITYSGITDYTGPLRIFSRYIGFGDIPADILNIPGVVFVMSVVLYPYVYLTSRAAFLLQSASRIEASRVLGAGYFRTFFRVALPMAWPGIFAGLTLVVMETLNDYGTVKYFGVSTFTTGIFKSWLSLGDMPTAILLALFLIAAVIIILWLEGRFQRRKKYAFKETPLARIPATGRKKWMITLLTAFPFVMGFVFPVFQMLYWTWLSYDRIILAELWKGVAGTSRVAFAVSGILVLIALLFHFLQRFQTSRRFREVLNTLGVLGYSMPGAVLGIGVVAWVLYLYPSWLFTSTVALGFGYISRFFAVAHNPIASAYRKIPSSLDESARLMGVSPLKILWRIHLPSLKPALLAASVMVFIDIVKELPLTLILRPFNYQTLASQAFQFATDEMAPQSAIPSLVIILVAAIPTYFLYRFLEK
jgi:iron(III) transport system permease protein